MGKARVAAVDEVPVGTLKRVDVDGTPICLAHAEDGNFYAISDICSHEEESLSEGDLFGCEVECPRHNSTFDLRTGQVSGPPALVAVASYPVNVEDGYVFVDVSA
jgi:3-phenylpropionate/trans-cinnamate dioxygenase ferredoxin subunit